MYLTKEDSNADVDSLQTTIDVMEKVQYFSPHFRQVIGKNSLCFREGNHEWTNRNTIKRLVNRYPTHSTVRCSRVQVQFWSLYFQVTQFCVIIYLNRVVVRSKQWIHLITNEYLQGLQNGIVPNLELLVCLIITG